VDCPENCLKGEMPGQEETSVGGMKYPEENVLDPGWAGSMLIM